MILWNPGVLISSFLFIIRPSTVLPQKDLYRGSPWTPRTAHDPIQFLEEDSVSLEEPGASRSFKFQRKPKKFNFDSPLNESKVQSEVNKIEVLGRGGNPVTISFGNASLLEPENRSFETEVKSILIEETNPSDQSQIIYAANTDDVERKAKRPSNLPKSFIPPRPIGPMLRPESYKNTEIKKQRRKTSRRRVDEDLPSIVVPQLSNRLEPPGPPDYSGVQNQIIPELARGRQDRKEDPTLVNIGDWAAQWDQDEEAWYYYNYLTEESTWIKPEVLKDVDFEPPLNAKAENINTKTKEVERKDVGILDELKKTFSSFGGISLEKILLFFVVKGIAWVIWAAFASVFYFATVTGRHLNQVGNLGETFQSSLLDIIERIEDFNNNHKTNV